MVRAFIEASVLAIPTGKQNSFAAQNKPAFGLIVVRKNGAPCSLANAFAKPISVGSDSSSDLVGHSIKELSRRHGRYKQVYGSDDIVCESVFQIDYEEQLGDLSALDRGSLQSAIDAALQGVAKAAEA